MNAGHCNNNRNNVESGVKHQSINRCRNSAHFLFESLVICYRANCNMDFC